MSTTSASSHSSRCRESCCFASPSFPRFFLSLAPNHGCRSSLLVLETTLSSACTVLILRDSGCVLRALMRSRDKPGVGLLGVLCAVGACSCELLKKARSTPASPASCRLRRKLASSWANLSGCTSPTSAKQIPLSSCCSSARCDGVGRCAAAAAATASAPFARSSSCGVS